MHYDLNYDYGKHGLVQRNNILYDTLISDQPEVLFVGEGDFSFTVAFAALRCFEKTKQYIEIQSTKKWKKKW